MMKEIIKEKILATVGDLFEGDLEVGELEVEVSQPKDEKFGDYTSNIAMVLAGKLKKSPIEIAEKVKNKIEKVKGADVDKIEVVKPGYINFYLSSEYLQKKVDEINKSEGSFGNNDIGQSKKVLIEFVSANPTGPIHLGNARGGPVGDILGNVMEKSGYEVEREFYVNDFGNQVLMLGHSILKDEKAQYKGDYVDDLAFEKDPEMTDPMEVGNWGANAILDKFIKPTCESSGVKFDNWFSEKSLHTSGKVDEAIEMLQKNNLVYEKDGATWFKSTQFGDDKDRVLIKSNGLKTYSATDFAYHKNKITRGFDKLINIQGADHHKQAEVVKSFVENFLNEKGKLELIMTQIVRVIKDGKEVKMSKRRGVYFALDDLLEEVGKDAVRFIFALYSPSSHVNFDIDTAKEKSEKNPVYYVQYAHARICSILEKSKDLEKVSGDKKEDLSLLVNEKELSLIKEMNKLPELIEDISKNYEVHRLAHYAIGLADKFHSFYGECRVVDEDNPELSLARLRLARAAREVLAETLRLLGVSAPVKM